MKKYFLTIITSFAITQGVHSQIAQQQIAYIEKETKEIKNNITKYQKIEKQDSLGNSNCIYKNNGELKLKKVYYQDTDANKNVEWYFANGELIYSQKIWTDKKTNNVIENEKCYLNNNHLIEWTKNGKSVDSTSEEFKRVSADLPAYGISLIAQTK